MKPADKTTGDALSGSGRILENGASNTLLSCDTPCKEILSSGSGTDRALMTALGDLITLLLKPLIAIRVLVNFLKRR